MILRIFALTFFSTIFGQLALSQVVGPMVGQVTASDARFLYRPGEIIKTLRLSVLDANDAVVGSDESTNSADDDYVVKFHVTGLAPFTTYRYQIEENIGGSLTPLVGPAPKYHFKTTLAPNARGTVTAALVSCADDTTEPVWERIAMLGADQVFLMGDTPYIDSPDLPFIRQRHRHFLTTPFMAALIQDTPTLGMWDDHDFGLNNSNGLSFLAGKQNTRKAFVEYRAHAQYGTGTEGVYHKIELGVMDVFLLDTRWFSQTAPSPVDPTQPTSFGATQWQWLLDGLKASRAPFKVLTTGQVWEDKKNAETDDMFTYWNERDALFNYIRDQNSPGVVLFGGDIHVSRQLIHPQRVGYDLQDFISSPGHTSVIPSLDVPHPDLEWSLVEGRQFLTLTADTRVNPPVLTARYILHDGTVAREVVIPYDELTPKAGEGLGRGLRAWWDFSGNLENKSLLGHRIDATAVNGASLVADGGLRGGAAEFSRAAQQYLLVPRSALDDNSAGHSVSLWCKPASLPADGTADRHFLMESTLGGVVSSGKGYTISLGFSASDAPDKVNLQLFTNTLQPAASASTAPTALSQGGFDCQLDRSLFTGRWAHVATTFDSSHLRLYVDGTEVADHPLPTPGPAAEFGGLVIGGHREGVGRNYDGQLDEIALWQRVLTPVEIATLYNSGSPAALPTAVAAADTDGDTLEDWYEVLYGLDPDDPADALADTDSDGVPAYLERDAGTNPTLNDSVFYDYLRNLTDPGGNFAPLAFRHPSLNTVRLRVEAQSGEDLTSWPPLVPGPQAVATITAGRLQVTSPALGSPKKFYRFATRP